MYEKLFLNQLDKLKELTNDNELYNLILKYYNLNRKNKSEEELVEYHKNLIRIFKNHIIPKFIIYSKNNLAILNFIRDHQNINELNYKDNYNTILNELFSNIFKSNNLDKSDFVKLDKIQFLLSYNIQLINNDLEYKKSVENLKIKINDSFDYYDSLREKNPIFNNILESFILKLKIKYNEIINKKLSFRNLYLKLVVFYNVDIKNVYDAFTIKINKFNDLNNKIENKFNTILNNIDNLKQINSNLYFKLQKKLYLIKQKYYEKNYDLLEQEIQELFDTENIKLKIMDLETFQKNIIIELNSIEFEKASIIGDNYRTIRELSQLLNYNYDKVIVQLDNIEYSQIIKEQEKIIKKLTDNYNAIVCHYFKKLKFQDINEPLKKLINFKYLNENTKKMYEHILEIYNRIFNLVKQNESRFFETGDFYYICTFDYYLNLLYVNYSKERNLDENEKIELTNNGHKRVGKIIDGTNKVKYYIIKGDKNLYGITDLNDNVIVDCKYHKIRNNLILNNFVVEDVDNKTFLIDENGNKVTKKYKEIIKINDYYYLAKLEKNDFDILDMNYKINDKIKDVILKNIISKEEYEQIGKTKYLALHFHLSHKTLDDNYFIDLYENLRNSSGYKYIINQKDLNNLSSTIIIDKNGNTNDQFGINLNHSISILLGEDYLKDKNYELFPISDELIYVKIDNYHIFTDLNGNIVNHYTCNQVNIANDCIMMVYEETKYNVVKIYDKNLQIIGEHKINKKINIYSRDKNIIISPLFKIDKNFNITNRLIYTKLPLIDIYNYSLKHAFLDLCKYPVYDEETKKKVV